VAVRHGREPGQVTLGGRRVHIRRPRVRTADGSWELPVPTYQAFASTDLLGQLALERMLAKLSTRRYPAGLEPVGAQVESTASGTSKSAISRRFVAATEHALAELLAADLAGLELVALMVDGVQVAGHCCVVALGITIDGTKVPLGLVEGATENATVVTDLLVGLRERGLDTSRPILVVIDGATALRRAVTDVFDHPVIQRCQLHKLRNVTDRLPDAVASVVASGCARPTASPTRWWPRPSWRQWRGSWTAPTLAPPRPCGKAWPRPSRSPGWACHPPWLERCGQPTRSSR
jgi:putative transposase